MKLQKSILLFLVLVVVMQLANAQNKLVGETKFKMHGAHVVIKASVNGSDPIDFVFDSGAQGAMIDETLANWIGLPVSGEIPVMGASGKRRTVKSSEGIVVTVNGVEFEKTSMIITDMSESKKFGRIHDGVLGFPLLSQYITEFDYQTSTIRFYEKEGYQYDGKGKEVAIDLSMRIPITDIELTLADNTKIGGKAMIDTGASSATSLNSPVVAENKMIENASKMISREGHGLTGSFLVHETRIPGVALAGFEFENVPATLSTATKGPKASDQYLGIIGNYIMNRFKITFDYSNRKMYLEPNDAYRSDFQVNCSGIQYHHYTTANNGFLITRVEEHSPAAKAGIKKGDELMKVNGKHVRKYGHNELLSLLSTDGKRVTLEWLSEGKVSRARITLKELI
ncbi:MAG: aspartyl protease family protein [Chitinophagales bacterium]|nr:aspartyl protease family protein [Chitinophagales bacterium]